ncbi:MAG TPA: hypothetical protein VFQ13_11690 [Anaerolineales bacterium]|nr:hypothetical protein [Anaerolineales bacterium]
MASEDYPNPLSSLSSIGVAFNIGNLSAFYGFDAWLIFMQTLDPKRLAPCLIFDGDTLATLAGRANEFCIGIYGVNLDLAYIREKVGNAQVPGFAPVHRRIIEKMALDDQPLVYRGRIDLLGRWETDEWTRIDSDLCEKAGWNYRPRTAPPTSNRTELKK